MFMLRQKEKHIPGPRTQSFLLDPIDWHLIAIRDVSQTRWQEARSKKPLCLQTYCLKCHGYNWKTSIAINGDKSLSPAIKILNLGQEEMKGKNLLRKVALWHTVTLFSPTSPLFLFCLHYLLPSCSFSLVMQWREICRSIQPPWSKSLGMVRPVLPAFLFHPPSCAKVASEFQTEFLSKNSATRHVLWLWLSSVHKGHGDWCFVRLHYSRIRKLGCIGPMHCGSETFRGSKNCIYKRSLVFTLTHMIVAGSRCFNLWSRSDW